MSTGVRAFLDATRQDVGFAVRTLRRAPAFALVAVMTLGFGIGATTAVFSVVNGVLLRKLPYREPERLVRVLERSKDGGNRPPSYPTFSDWQAEGAALRGTIDGMAFARGDIAHRTMLFHTTPGDATAYLGVAAILGAASLLATYLPARRAARADPMIAMRAD